MAGVSDTLRALTADLESAAARSRALVDDRDRNREAWERWVTAGKEWRQAAVRLGDWVTQTELALFDGESSGVDAALTYLELDLFYFWSGFHREHVARRLAAATMSPAQRGRARTYVLRAVDGELHCGQPGLSRLAGAVADNALRRELRQRLHYQWDFAVPVRAMQALLRVKHPGYSPADLAAARGIALRRRDVQMAERLWSPAWEEELRELTQHHDPERAGAKQLLRYRDYRRSRKDGRVPDPARQPGSDNGTRVRAKSNSAGDCDRPAP